MPFFESLGFQLPDRKGVADFLQEVTSEKDQKVCNLVVSSDVMHTSYSINFESSIAKLVSPMLLSRHA